MLLDFAVVVFLPIYARKQAKHMTFWWSGKW